MLLQIDHLQPSRNRNPCVFRQGIAGTVSELNNKVYVQIEAWRNRMLKSTYPYVFQDGIYLKPGRFPEPVSAKNPIVPYCHKLLS